MHARAPCLDDDDRICERLPRKSGEGSQDDVELVADRHLVRETDQYNAGMRWWIGLWVAKALVISDYRLAVRLCICEDRRVFDRAQSCVIHMFSRMSRRLQRGCQSPRQVLIYQEAPRGTARFC
jgi:hypothetical protein